MESQTEPSHPWAHSTTLPAKEDLKSQISPWNSHRAFKDGRHVTLEETHSPIKTTKALKIIRRVGPDSLAGILWWSLINHICCVADAKKQGPSGTSQHLSGAELCWDVMLQHRVSDWDLTLQWRGELQGTVLLRGVSWGEIGEITLLSGWSPVIPGWASSLVTISDLL